MCFWFGEWILTSIGHVGIGVGVGGALVEPMLGVPVGDKLGVELGNILGLKDGSIDAEGKVLSSSVDVISKV